MICDTRNFEILIMLFAIIVIRDMPKIKIVIRDTGRPLLGPYLYIVVVLSLYDTTHAAES